MLILGSNVSEPIVQILQVLDQIYVALSTNPPGSPRQIADCRIAASKNVAASQGILLTTVMAAWDKGAKKISSSDFDAMIWAWLHDGEDGLHQWLLSRTEIRPGWRIEDRTAVNSFFRDSITKLDSQHGLHEPLGSPLPTLREEIQTLEQASVRAPQLTDDGDQQTVVARRRRDPAFELKVKLNYNYACAMCGSRLCSPNGQWEVQSAHIFPKELNGADDLRNGICLCRIHHWAFDVGWISIADDWTILVRSDLPESQEYQVIRALIGRKLAAPQQDRPHPIYLREHRRLKGFPA